MTYYVLDDAGNQYGPADEALLRQWVQEGRIQPGTSVREAVSGTTMLASAVPGIFYGGTPFGSPPSGNPYEATPYANPQPGGGPVPGYAYQPRPTDSATNEITTAWVLSIAGMAFSLICCGFTGALLGLGLGVGGVILARRGVAAGDSRAQAPLYTSYATIGLALLMLVVSAVGRAALGS